MIQSLKKTDLKRTLNNISENPYNFLVYSTDSFVYAEDQKKFEYNIEVLEYINTVHLVNAFLKTIDSTKVISTNILHKILDAGFTGEVFTDELLTEYYGFIIEMGMFSNSLNKIKQIETYVPLEIELSLYGLSIKEHKALTEPQKEYLCEEHGSIFVDVEAKKISITECIYKIKTLIVKVKNCIPE